MKLLEIYASCRRAEALMKNYYRELALYKTHASYWLHCHHLAHELNDRQESWKEYSETWSEARKKETQIAELTAEFVGLVRKFQVIKPLPLEIESILDATTELTYPKAKSYDSTVSRKELEDGIIEADENNLKERFYQKLKLYKEINDYLQGNLLNN